MGCCVLDWQLVSSTLLAATLETDWVLDLELVEVELSSLVSENFPKHHGEVSKNWPADLKFPHLQMWLCGYT
jgi:hypothetical protein